MLATQRPSVDVITGLIKANFPSRISYRVSSKVDSRTILDTNGAEHLLGRGDMLFLPPGSSRLLRVHGAYIDETEINKIVTHIKGQWEPDYDETITQSDEEAMGLEDSGGERDELFEEALRICVDMKRASTSVLQRRLRIGYGRAAAVLDQMEREGLIGKADGARPRPVLARSRAGSIPVAVGARASCPPERAARTLSPNKDMLCDGRRNRRGSKILSMPHEGGQG